VLDSLTTDALTPIVRRALENPFAVPTAWQWSPIAYKRYLSARTLARVDGTADTGRGGVLAPWSVVVKIFQPPTDCADSATEDGSWEREVLAYRSGLLADLPGALVAPRVLDIHTDDSGNRWLWLEHITDMYGVWPRQHYGVAARHLGYFNGTYMTSRQLPEYSWLDRDWAKSLSDPAVQVEAIDGLLSHPLAREAFDRPLAGRARALLEDQPHFLRILSELPQTLCHHDAARANLFARLANNDGMETETVAIDWEGIGPGTVGADLATLVFGTMRRCEFPSSEAAALDQLAFEGYLHGLRDSGWRGEHQ